MKDKETIIQEAVDKSGFTTMGDIIKIVWNTAIEMAAEEAMPKGGAGAPIDVVYKYDHKSGRSYYIDKESITKLKFDI